MTGEPRQRADQAVVRIVALGALAHALDDAPAKLGVLGTHRLTGGAAHRGPRLAGRDSDSQAAGGATWALEVRISTSSPFCSSDASGAILPLILQPTAWLPTSVCTA